MSNRRFEGALFGLGRSTVTYSTIDIKDITRELGHISTNLLSESAIKNSVFCGENSRRSTRPKKLPRNFASPPTIAANSVPPRTAVLSFRRRLELDNVRTGLIGVVKMPCAPQILVDDDAAVRKLFAAVLAKDGYAVSSVATGRHAISVVRDRDFDLIILDVGLPDIDGLELMTELRSERPHLKAVIVSGGGLPSAGTAGVVVALEKPLKVRALRQAVYSALAESLSWLTTASG